MLITQCTDYPSTLIPHSSECTLILQCTDYTLTLIPHLTDCMLILQCTGYTSIPIPHSIDCMLITQCTDHISILIPHSSDCTLMLQCTDSTLILIPHSTDCTLILPCTDCPVTPIPHSTDCMLITLCTDCTLEPLCQRDSCTINSTPELVNQSNSNMWPANLTGLLWPIWRFPVNNITWCFGSTSRSFEPSLAVLLSGVGRLAGSEGYFTFIQALPVALLQPFLQLFHQHLPTRSANINTVILPSPHSRLPSLHSCLPHHTVISLHYTVVSIHYTVVSFHHTVAALPYSCLPSPQLFPFTQVCCCVDALDKFSTPAVILFYFIF